jgi:hypothetical protein
MVSKEHEVVVEMFRNRAKLAPEFGEVLGVKLPSWSEARADASDLNELVPTEYRADLVVLLERGEGKEKQTVYALVVEAQLSADPRKRMVWPQYLTSLRARLECPTTLLVVTPDEAVERWCEEAIEIGHPRWVLYPVVLGPSRIPVVDSMEVARENPELLVLSALVHGRTQAGRRIVRVLPALDSERTRLYARLIVLFLGEEARQELEEMMRSDNSQEVDFFQRFVDEGMERGMEKGVVKGKAADVLEVLDTRGLQVDAQARERIVTCTDLGQLQRWLRKAVTVKSVQELLEPESGSRAQEPTSERQSQRP